MIIKTWFKNYNETGSALKKASGERKKPSHAGKHRDCSGLSRIVNNVLRGDTQVH